MITKFRRGAVIGTAVAAAFVGALFVVPPPASAMPMAQAAIAPAGPGCPTGTNTIVPDAAAVKKYGAQAIVPRRWHTTIRKHCTLRPCKR